MIILPILPMQTICAAMESFDANVVRQRQLVRSIDHAKNRVEANFELFETIDVKHRLD